MKEDIPHVSYASNFSEEFDDISCGLLLKVWNKFLSKPKPYGQPTSRVLVVMKILMNVLQLLNHLILHKCEAGNTLSHIPFPAPRNICSVAGALPVGVELVKLFPEACFYY